MIYWPNLAIMTREQLHNYYGQHARKCGLQKADNPNKKGTDEWKWWNKGSTRNNESVGVNVVVTDPGAETARARD